MGTSDSGTKGNAPTQSGRKAPGTLPDSKKGNGVNLRVQMGRGFWTSRAGLGLLCAVLLVLLAGTGVFVYYYIEFGHLIQQRLTGQIFQNTSRVYSSPEKLFPSEAMHRDELTGYLLRAGYTDGPVEGSPGEFDEVGTSLEIRPTKSSFFRGTNALRVTFAAGKIASITSLSTSAAMDQAEVEPELLTNLFDTTREKRRVLTYDELPPLLVHSVLAAEDKRFFEHGAFDPVRIIGAAVADLKRGQRAQGASTIDMQVARSFFFSTKREWRRKIKETIVALELNQRFTKQQIFDLYANEVYLGNRGSFSIRGFGEAAQAYFGKDLRDLSLGEDAFLAGIIRAPNRYSLAEHHPDRAVEARDRVLTQMVEDGYIPAEQAAVVKKQTLKFVTGSISGGLAPYFVDMVKDHLLSEYSESDLASQSFGIYTTLDPDLQDAASKAVAYGMANVDKLLARRYAKWKKEGQNVPQAQVALVALDPRTGEIRALVGGRDYGESQLNHALARRQPGSVFKPFVYAAAFDNAVQGLQPVVTPVTTVDDDPTTFEFDGKEYTPNNYGEHFYGMVTARDALIHSLNVATIKVAEMVGYDRVVSLAKEMGITSNILPTPALALGAYEMTPVEVAAGYTPFATDGLRAEPLFIREEVDADGQILERNDPKIRPVLDPRVAYEVTSLMEDVINQGTGVAVRELGFDDIAAGKTGTSRDGWFAGFTPNLLCVVWIGFDDNRDLDLSGSATAAPLWTEFMKLATQLPAYRDTGTFSMPAGDVEVTIDPESGELATPNCPMTRQEVFVIGTEPTQFCELHPDRNLQQAESGSWLSRLFGSSGAPPPPSQPTNAPPSKSGTAEQPPVASQPAPAAAPIQPDEEKKKGILHKIFGIFGDDKKPPEASHP